MFTSVLDSLKCRNVPHLTFFVPKIIVTKVFTEMHSRINQTSIKPGHDLLMTHQLQLLMKHQ